MAMLNNQRVNILTICRRYLLQKSDVLMYRLHTGPLQCCCEITAVCRWNPDACWFCLAKFMAKSIKRPILISGWNQRMFPLKPSDPSWSIMIHHDPSWSISIFMLMKFISSGCVSLQFPPRKTWFFLDFITLIPFDLMMATGGEDSVVAELKTVKVARETWENHGINLLFIDDDRGL